MPGTWTVTYSDGEDTVTKEINVLGAPEGPPAEEPGPEPFVPGPEVKVEQPAEDYTWMILIAILVILGIGIAVYLMKRK
jgi:hypothetical protein